MEVDDDEYIVDLSVSSRRSTPSSNPSSPMDQVNTTKRILRPRTEIRNYVEAPDDVMISDIDEIKQNGYTNGYDYSDSDDCEMPLLSPIKELSEEERTQAENTIKILRDELRNEEMKLILLKKLRQSQQMKENIATILPVNNSVTIQPIIPSHQTFNKMSPSNSNYRSLSHHNSSNSNSLNNSNKHLPTSPQSIQTFLKGQIIPPRSSSVHNSVPVSVLNNHQSGRSIAPGMPSNMFPVTTLPLHKSAISTVSISSSVIQNNVVTNGGISRSSVTITPTNLNSGSTSYQNNNMTSLQERLKEISPSNSVTVTPAVSSSPNTLTQQEKPKIEDTQTPAQRQAAAKLALRKQLEKTLLQIPPPKPPPPEMHFIPNPSNTEFGYLLGLEHVVDFLTQDQKKIPPPDPFCCSQCDTDFTPVWKWEKNPSKGKEPNVICEACVTSNVKKALKAEHTNRLKTAFVKALQQEQEIEQRLAQCSPQPAESPTHTPVSTQLITTTTSALSISIPSLTLPSSLTVTSTPLLYNTASTVSTTLVPPPPSSVPKSSTPNLTSLQRHNSTPPIPSPSPTPPREHSHSSRDHSHSSRDHSHSLGKPTNEPNKFSPHHAAAALHQQLLRGLPSHQPLPAHMLPFSHFLYPYQLAMAQAANSKNPVVAAASLVELQRQAADFQRQYLLDIMPPNNSSSRHNSHSINNWKS